MERNEFRVNWGAWYISKAYVGDFKGSELRYLALLFG